jgi:hypothetical protein
MIRATHNESIKRSSSAGIKGQSKELCYGSDDGINAAQIHVMTEIEWEANAAANANSTISVVPSDRHHGPYAV